MENKVNWKPNLIFVAVLLAVAAGIFLWQRANAAPGLYAQLQYGSNGEETMDIPLNKDETYDIDTGSYTIHLEVADGQIRFIDSPCPDHLCEQFGWLSEAGDFAVCMPAMSIVTVKEG